MQQLAGCGAERELITERFAALSDELADLWRRAEAAATPTITSSRPYSLTAV